MLASRYRLKKKKDFTNVLREGKGFRESFLVIKAAENHLENPRFGFVVSKKVAKGAAKRNKIKRRLRDAVRRVLKEGEVANQDIVIIALPDIVGQEWSDIEQAIKKTFRKLKKLF